MEVQLLRHATVIVRIANHTILVDPMFSPAEAMDPVPNSANARRNPLVGLPLDADGLAHLLEQTNMVIVTHTHPDHWDTLAVQMLAKHIPVLCQPPDTAHLEQDGFTAVHPVSDVLDWQNIRVSRTGGQHGTGEIGQQMAPVSGFVLQADGEPTLYIAGDTIWCPEVADALATYQPDITVVNAGAAQFLIGDPITMTAEDVVQVCQARPAMQVIAVHLEVVNHCLLTRADLRAHLEQAGVASQVVIPMDGEVVISNA